jgi:hypothetical protein
VLFLVALMKPELLDDAPSAGPYAVPPRLIEVAAATTKLRAKPTQKKQAKLLIEGIWRLGDVNSRISCDSRADCL